MNKRLISSLFIRYLLHYIILLFYIHFAYAYNKRKERKNIISKRGTRAVVFSKLQKVLYLPKRNIFLIAAGRLVCYSHCS